MASRERSRSLFISFLVLGLSFSTCNHLGSASSDPGSELGKLGFGVNAERLHCGCQHARMRLMSG